MSVCIADLGGGAALAGRGLLITKYLNSSSARSSIFFGLALFTLVAYIILSFALDPMPDNMAFGEQLPSSSELLDEVDRELAASETRLREMERYVTSDTFTLRSRFRQL